MSKYKYQVTHLQHYYPSVFTYEELNDAIVKFNELKNDEYPVFICEVLHFNGTESNEFDEFDKELDWT